MDTRRRSTAMVRHARTHVARRVLLQLRFQSGQIATAQWSNSMKSLAMRDWVFLLSSLSLAVWGCSGQRGTASQWPNDSEIALPMDSSDLTDGVDFDGDEVADGDQCAPGNVAPQCPSGLVRVPGECDPVPPPVIEGVELVPRCWSIVAAGPETPSRVLSGLAADGDRIYFVSQRNDPAARTFLHAIDSDGDLVWETRVHGFDAALPPIVRHDRSILLFGYQGSTESPGAFYRGFMGTYDRHGNLIDARDLRQYVAPENWKYLELGVSSAAAALDANGNAYIVLGDHLTSIDADGEMRWARSVGKESDGCRAWFGSWLPTVIDEHVYVITEGSWFYRFTLDGTLVSDVALPSCTRPENVTPDLVGRLIVPSFDGALVLEQDGRVAWTWPLVRGEMIPYAIGTSGEVYSASETFRVFEEATEVWKLNDGANAGGGSSGMMVDQEGDVGFFTDLGRLRVISTSERRIRYEAVASGRMAGDVQGRTQHPLHLPDGLVVWAGRGHVPGYQPTSFVAAVRGQLGPARLTGWRGGHGDNRNHRQISLR